MLLVKIRDPDRVIPRYCPDKPFPSYRYLPGVDPHPLRDPAGHSYQGEPQPKRHRPWQADDWRTQAAWRWGVDLFNALYFWEAHEAWEGLWAAQPRDSVVARLLQGLIQIAAALLKIRQRSLAGSSTLSREGLAKVAQVAAVTPVLLGLDLRRVVRDFTNYFRPLAERTLPSLDASVPLLTLSAQLEAMA